MTSSEAHEARHWSDWIRQDVGAVRPLGAYAAKRCPVRTQLDVLRPVEPLPLSPFATMLAGRGDAFEAAAVAALDDQLGLVAPTAADPAELATATRDAMRRGDRVIAGGRLPVDEQGRRVGEPDLLVRVGERPADGRWRYAPVDIKSHRMLNDEGRGTPVVVQPLDALAVPPAGVATAERGRADRTARDDTLQLAHYHRLLDACGHAADGAAWGGVLGTDEQVVWFRLDVPRWSTATADPELHVKHRTALEVYDFEFAFRLDVAATAQQHVADATVPLLVEPVRCGECGDCPWRDHCMPQLERRGDVSLLPGVGFATWRALQEAGLGTIDRLAEPHAAQAVDGVRDRTLAELRLQARARQAAEPTVPRGPSRPPVPVADVEVDVDMENDLDGAYLWGAWVTDRVGGGAAEPGYHAFVTWQTPFGPEERADVFLRFWAWLEQLRAACARDGHSFAAFCWYEAAENRYLRDGAALTGRTEEVERFIASPDWIDLHRWFKTNHVTGRGNGLKTVAGLLGFAWRDDDPGGAASMAWREQALDPELDAERRHAARERLLAYNEDDVRATLAVRDALRRRTDTPADLGRSD